MPVLKVDNSKSRMNGSLYLVWADQRNGENDTDIWFMRSTNQGDFGHNRCALIRMAQVNTSFYHGWP
jgi:carbohydrate-selective porin OprB